MKKSIYNQQIRIIFWYSQQQQQKTTIKKCAAAVLVYLCPATCTHWITVPTPIHHKSILRLTMMIPHLIPVTLPTPSSHHFVTLSLKSSYFEFPLLYTCNTQKCYKKKENKFVNHKGDKSGGGVHSEPCHWTCGLCPAVKGKLQNLSIFHVLVPRNIRKFALYGRVNKCFLLRTCLDFNNGTQWDNGIHFTHLHLMHDFPGT